jgi:hypothetical protein
MYYCEHYVESPFCLLWAGPTPSPTPVNNWAVFNDFRITFTSEFDCRNTNVVRFVAEFRADVLCEP